MDLDLGLVKILITSGGDIEKIRADREDREIGRSEEGEPNYQFFFHEENHLENRETFKKLSGKEKLVRPIK